MCVTEKKKKSKKQRTDAGPSSAGAASTAVAPAAAPAFAPAPEPAAPAPPPPAIPSEETLPHLACTVCLSFPEKDILQCNAGHILCRTCYEQVLHQERPQCPTCRDVLDTTREVRNTLAEQTIAMLRVACPNEPCAVNLTRGTLERHLKCECAFRPVCCKYSLLGCKWQGIASGLAAHEDQCKRADMPGWKLLEKVKAKSDAVAAEHRAELAERAKGQRVLDALSSRCRNVDTTHVVLHKCSAHEHVASRPAHLVSAAFHAIGCRWKIYTVYDPGLQGGPATYSAAVQLRDDMRQQLAADCFLLRGPALADAGLTPALISQTFGGSARQRTTEPVVLATGAAADALEKQEKLELRVGLVDRRVGRLSAAFAGHVPGRAYGDGGSSEQDDWGSEGDMDDEGDDDDGFDSDDSGGVFDGYGGGGGGGGGGHHRFY